MLERNKYRGCYTTGNDSNAREPYCIANFCDKLNVFNWLRLYPIKNYYYPDIVEVKFKNTRKDFYANINKIRLKQGDIVAVEANPGHDIGIITLVGELVYEQMRKKGIVPGQKELKKIYRKAKLTDIHKWERAMELEVPTMLKARKIARDIGLNMKITDVEYQADKTKAIFYYIADERVDFRELIKILAAEFKVRIEMRQIGVRQESALIGGIGPCGRELCCCTWKSNFKTVSTNAIRIQELSINPQKLTGLCAKLKCCINYELDCYIDAKKNFPDISIPLVCKKGKAYFQKSDVFKKILWYSFEKDNSENLIPIPLNRVNEIIELNKKGIIVEKLIEEKNNKNKSNDYELTINNPEALN